MPLEQFDGETFVAFMDISGFKSMMHDGDGRRAVQALNNFYSIGFDTLKEMSNDAVAVDGLFVSDCGILFSRGQDLPESQRLAAMLRAVERISRRCSEHAVFLATSVSWGQFSYHQRIEFPGIEKNPIYGGAYIRAFADNEGGSPKIYSGDCRVVRADLPPEAIQYCERRQDDISSRLRTTTKHYYFEWTRLRGQGRP